MFEKYIHKPSNVTRKKLYVYQKCHTLMRVKWPFLYQGKIRQYVCDSDVNERMKNETNTKEDANAVSFFLSPKSSNFKTPI